MRFHALLGLCTSASAGSLVTPVEVGSGGYCKGEQVQQIPCFDKSGCGPACVPVHCELSDWHEWSACNCEALKERNRGIKKHNNQCGHPCNASLTETHPCQTNCTETPVDCTMSDWSSWSTCEAGTDKFQKVRTRQPSVPQAGGDGCNGSVREIIPCEDIPDPNKRDCKWNDWSHWSACTCTCDGGQKTRDRSVAVAPRGGGKACADKTKTQIAPCNTQPCNSTPCVDGVWGDWEDWGLCNADCDGGIQWRHRPIAKEANACGHPPAGKSAEVKTCNTQGCGDVVDCEFADWGPWSSCSCSCDGIEHRSRVISKYGTKGGKYCIGGTKEVRSCNNATTTDGCKPDKKVDCKLSDWTEWGTCTQQCDGGQTDRMRQIKTQNRYGGKPCNGTLKETVPCKTDACAGPDPIDCSFNDWSDWSACDKCGGEKKRFRTIATMPKHHGAPCKFEETEEVTDCTRHCHDPWYCVWSPWTNTSKCSNTCGDGVLEQRRHLYPTNTTTTTVGSVEQFEVEPVGAQSRLQDLMISFACGSMVTFLVLMVSMRVFRRQNRYNTVRDAEQTHLVDMRAAE